MQNCRDTFSLEFTVLTPYTKIPSFYRTYIFFPYEFTTLVDLRGIKNSLTNIKNEGITGLVTII